MVGRRWAECGHFLSINESGPPDCPVVGQNLPKRKTAPPLLAWQSEEMDREIMPPYRLDFSCSSVKIGPTLQDLRPFLLHTERPASFPDAGLFSFAFFMVIRNWKIKWIGLWADKEHITQLSYPHSIALVSCIIRHIYRQGKSARHGFRIL